jgi:hypothetical protein
MAQRIRHGRIGQTLDVRFLTSDRLRSLITHVMLDKSYRVHTRLLQRLMGNPVDEAVELIGRYAPGGFNGDTHIEREIRRLVDKWPIRTIDHATHELGTGKRWKELIR